MAATLCAGWRLIEQFQACDIAPTVSLYGIPEDHLGGEQRMRGKLRKIQAYR